MKREELIILVEILCLINKCAQLNPFHSEYEKKVKEFSTEWGELLYKIKNIKIED